MRWAIIEVRKTMDNQVDIEKFLTQFFTANHCEVAQMEPGKISVQLTIEMDKALMNRPFYWQYMESTGNVGEPKKLTFILDPDKIEKEGEWIHFGSPRLEQIYKYLRNTAKFIHLFEEVNVSKNTMLHPWLLLNYCIIYEGKQKKEELFSIGLNLINGTFLLNMMEHLEHIELAPTISDHCYTISPLIKVNSGFLRIENYIHDYVMKQEHDWAIESLKLLQEEIAMIHHFYESDQDNKDEMEKELDDITARLEPHITYEVINGGMIYLRDTFANGINK